MSHGTRTLLLFIALALVPRVEAAWPVTTTVFDIGDGVMIRGGN